MYLFARIFAMLLVASCIFTASRDGISAEVTQPQQQVPLAAPPLAKLERLSQALFRVRGQYIEPDRIRYPRMYDAVLRALEAEIPTALFRKSGGELLHVQVDDAFTVISMPPWEVVPPERGLQVLLAAVYDVALFVQENLDVSRYTPSGDDPSLDPWVAIEYAMINGALSTLDPHSKLLPPKASQELDEDNQGAFGGLGITVVERSGKLIVAYPMPDTPAEAAGVLAGDHIVRIDDAPTLHMNLDDAIERLRGVVGTSVVLTVAREGESAPIAIPITRDVIKVNPVEGQLLDGGVGYLSIRSFHANVRSELDDALDQLKLQNNQRALKGVIVDLRGNPGGYLNQAVAVSDRFLSEGTIVSTVDRNGYTSSSELASPLPANHVNYPMAVLINAHSASASEIVAGALRRNDRAVVIGERSFGKGSVQSLTNFSDGSKLKLTIAHYLTPSGHSIQSLGIPADIQTIPTVIRPSTGGADPTTLVYWRDRVGREADLDQHLDQQATDLEKPTYRVPFLRPKLRKPRHARIDVRQDTEVQLAREVLLAATDWRRPQVLASAARVVGRYVAQGDGDRLQAFEPLGIDWRAGPAVQHPSLDVTLELPKTGVFRAGERAALTLRVTNRGTQPVYRLGAVCASQEPLLSGLEFFWGMVPAGATRTYTRHVAIPVGYPVEHTPVTFQLRGEDGPLAQEYRTHVPVVGHAVPQFAWRWQFDDTVGGNGDGLAQVGEQIRLHVTVQNVGTGPTVQPFIRLTTHNYASLQLSESVVHPGKPLTAAGEPCQPGPDCTWVLGVGESVTESFDVTLQSSADQDYVLQLAVGDAQAFDRVSAYRAGFQPYAVNETTLTFRAGLKLPASKQASLPTIVFSEAPAATGQSQMVTISGVVQDDHRVAYVLVYHGDTKIALEASPQDGDLRSVPFTADVVLSEGPNQVVVLAVDDEGFRQSASVVTDYRPAQVATQQTESGVDSAPAIR